MDKNLLPVLSSFSEAFCKILRNTDMLISEIRIRSDKPVVLYADNSPHIVTDDGDILPADTGALCGGRCISFGAREIKNAFSRICEYSVYKYQSEINNGFITVNGGHRIGVCGTAVIGDGRVKAVSDISSLNIRIAHEFIGCSNELLERAGADKGILICGMPSSGKTTLLRDIGRTLSVCCLKKVSIADERGEIAARSTGEYCFDTGLCDVYSGYPKSKAIIDAIRTMSPDFIICDELTGSDTESVLHTLNYGVKLIASVHCDSIDSARRNPSVRGLIDTGAFEKIVFLNRGKPCSIGSVYNLGDVYDD